MLIGRVSPEVWSAIWLPARSWRYRSPVTESPEQGAERRPGRLSDIAGVVLYAGLCFLFWGALHAVGLMAFDSFVGAGTFGVVVGLALLGAERLWEARRARKAAGPSAPPAGADRG